MKSIRPSRGGSAADATATTAEAERVAEVRGKAGATAGLATGADAEIVPRAARAAAGIGATIGLRTDVPWTGRLRHRPRRVRR
jgi:hypothetical protein